VFEHSGDCVDQRTGVKNRCVVAAISNYTNQLLQYGTYTQSNCKPFFFQTNLIYSLLFTLTIFPSLSYLSDNLTEALLFLSHFIGDIHQVYFYLYMHSTLVLNQLLSPMKEEKT